MKNILKKKEGITLIALVITIIVLLLLAGVSISMLSGQDGILSKASQAKQLTNETEISDGIKQAYLTAMTEGEGKITESLLQEALNDQFGSVKAAGSITKSGEEIKSVTIDGISVEFGESANAKQWTWTDNQEEGTEGYGEISVGDLITHKEKGNEKFYVIKVDGDNVAMLAAKNITTTGTLEQSDSAPTIKFSNTNYWSSYAGTYPLDLNTYIPADATQIKDTDAIEIARAYGDTFDVTGSDVKGRLMTLEEICSEDIGGNMSNNSISACPSFINSKNYWLGSAYGGSPVWVVLGGNSTLYGDDFFYGFDYGLRPVLEISASSIE